MPGLDCRIICPVLQLSCEYHHMSQLVWRVWLSRLKVASCTSIAVYAWWIFVFHIAQQGSTSVACLEGIKKKELKTAEAIFNNQDMAAT